MESRTRQIIDERYVLQDALQTGGMTTVYKARDLETDELVALKRFDRDRHLPEIERETYHREVESLRRLSHENIVRLINWGEDREGKVYLVLDLMKHDLVEERNLHGLAFSGWDDFADLVVLPLLRALAYAHEVGIAHRDVKPANVLVASDGTVKLADFGISKLKRTLQPRLTLSEFMSPPFSPPEADASGDTYARDVYAVGVLCLWALSNSSLQEHSDLASALDEFDAPPEVEALVRRSIALDPKQRFRSAALMATEIERIQAKRRQFWAETERKGCMLRITKCAFDAAMDELCTSDETEIRKFIGEDINLDSCIERFVEKPGSMDARVRAGHYSVIGTSFRYHVAESDRGHEGFALVNILRPEPHFLQRDREFAASSPIRFEFQALTGSLSKRDALKLIEQTLEDFERKRREAERTDRKTALFDLWSRVLGAQLQFEREKSKPIAFLNSSVDGAFATLHTEQETDGVEIGEPRFVESGDGRRIRGDVWDVSVGTIVLNCIGANLANFPSQGVAKLDLFAMQVALDRQNNAINRIRNGTSVAPRLRDLMTNPGRAALPTESPTVVAEMATSLDESKRDAVGKAMAASDFLLVQGPPGTGKTQFIVALILETLRQKPDARVLLTSQTHIAIDNAIERLGKHLAHGQILRIARDYSGRVQESAEPFLIDNQMGRWREEVQVAAASGLERWAEANGLNPLDIRAGAFVGQIAALRQRLEAARQAIHDEDERRRGLARMRDMLPKAEWDCEVESVENHLQDLRDRLELDKKELGTLEERLVKVRPDGKSLLELSAEEQSQWASVLLGDSPQERAAAHLIRLQGEWLDRFGAARGFIRPLIEKSSVTAATCVGVASIEEMEDVEFDLGIIDEASKATAMEACVPTSRCKRWILVGDSKQLPPFREEVLVRTDLRERFDIQADEASESLFERFRPKLPAECQTTLRKQYRMVEPVGRLISDCFYDGELESVNKQIDPILSSVTSRVVNWFTTRGLSSRFEQPAGTSFVNPEEAAGIIEILSDIDRAIGASTDPVSRSAMILSGYAAQANHLDRRTHNLQFRHLKIECCTIDRVQGREADIVLLSLTRSNAHRSAGFLGALERVNVALSRAREFLAIVGDDEFVEQTANAEGLRRVLAHIRSWPSECAVVNLAEYRRRRRPS